MSIETNIKASSAKIKEDAERLRREIQERTVGYITTALGLVAGLAWNEAIKAVIEYVFPMDSSTLLAKIIYALLVTLMVVVLSSYLLRLAQKGKTVDTK